MSAILRGVGVTKRYGGLTAVDQLDFEVEKGDIFAVIGPNGSGKTTLINLISGMTRLSAGEIWFGEIPLHKRKAHEIARLGLARTFQIMKPFRTMNCRENVAMGAVFARGRSLRAGLELADELLESLGLGPRACLPVVKLSVAEWRRLELARALAIEPRVLLLDEVMAGMVPGEVEMVMGVIRRFNLEKGITILIVEHIMRAVMGLAHRVLVLDQGRKIAFGSPEEVARDEKVIKAYLGQEYSIEETGASAKGGIRL